MKDSYPIDRPSHFVLQDVDPTILGEHVLRMIGNGYVFVATPDELKYHELKIGIVQQLPETRRPTLEPRTFSIWPAIVAAVL